MEFIKLNPPRPNNPLDKKIWDFIKLAESNIGNQGNKSNQASYVRGMKAIFNFFTSQER